jgi:hypothetical protein
VPVLNALPVDRFFTPVCAGAPLAPAVLFPAVVVKPLVPMVCGSQLYFTGAAAAAPSGDVTLWMMPDTATAPEQAAASVLIGTEDARPTCLRDGDYVAYVLATGAVAILNTAQDTVAGVTGSYASARALTSLGNEVCFTGVVSGGRRMLCASCLSNPPAAAELYSAPLAPAADMLWPVFYRGKLYTRCKQTGGANAGPQLCITEPGVPSTRVVPFRDEPLATLPYDSFVAHGDVVYFAARTGDAAAQPNLWGIYAPAPV